MAEPYPPPGLTPQYCFNERALRDFLRLSRASIDDTLSTSLNALLTPATSSPFTPSSTGSIPGRPQGTRHPIPSEACQEFMTRVLFPSWESRSQVMTYCASVATSPDPDDPTLLDREVESRRERDRIVDERLDPYSGRSAAGLYRREARTESLAALLRNERMVEQIIRTRSWGVIGDRCAGGANGRWEDALDKWRDQQGNARR